MSDEETWQLNTHKYVVNVLLYKLYIYQEYLMTWENIHYIVYH